jgi:hypothetical protein
LISSKPRAEFALGALPETTPGRSASVGRRSNLIEQRRRTSGPDISTRSLTSTGRISSLTDTDGLRSRRFAVAASDGSTPAGAAVT